MHLPHLRTAPLTGHSSSNNALTLDTRPGNEPEEDELILLPLRGDEQYVFVGENRTEFAAKTEQSNPRLLEDGTPYAFTFPFASISSLKVIARAAEERHNRLSFTANGPVLEDADGFAMGLVDGVWRLVHGNIAGVVRVGCSIKGKYLHVGIIVVSGENK